MKNFLILFAFVFGWFSVISVESFLLGNSSATINYRLPNNTIPIHYDVDIFTRVHLKEAAFNGTVRIRIKLLEYTKTIVLHARQLAIESAMIIDGFRIVKCIADYPLENPTEFLILRTSGSQYLTKGKEVIVEIKYKGNLTEDNKGFFRSSYEAADGTEKWLALTQFESTNARHAFPCYDEPAKRATFTFSFTHGKSYNVISNTKPIGDPVPINNTDLVKTTFTPTPSMSTYITAFIISDLVHNETTFRGLKQRVYSRPNTTHLRQLALNAAPLVIETLDEYFEIKFKTMLQERKLDHVAAPGFYHAMENWGSIIYNEDLLLYENDKPNIETETLIVNIISHEDVHQWFGDYVSIEWWTYVWLKESFAQYYSYIAMDKVSDTYFFFFC